MGILSLFVLATVTFFLTRAIPGSPFQGANVSESVLQMMEEEYGLHQPDRKSTRLNSSHSAKSRMPSSA